MVQWHILKVIRLGLNNSSKIQNTKNKKQNTEIQIPKLVTRNTEVKKIKNEYELQPLLRGLLLLHWPVIFYRAVIFLKKVKK
jgi:hypothetical protein